MINNTRPAFIAKEDFAKIFQNKIFRKTGIKLEVSPFKNGEVVLSVDKASYNDIISTAFKIVDGMYSINDYHIRWINENQQECPLRFISLFTGYLPDTRKYNPVGKACPPDIEEYKLRLESILQRRIIVRYNEQDNSLDFLVQASPLEFSSLRVICEEVMKGKNSPFPEEFSVLEGSSGKVMQSPFAGVVWPVNFAGRVLKIGESTKTPKIKDFFTSSLFVKVLTKPESIESVKSVDKTGSGYVLNNVDYGVRKLETKDIESEQGKIVIGGEYVTYEKRYYDYISMAPWTHTIRDNSPKEPHIMLDNATFKASVDIETLTEIKVQTNVDLVRSIMECNFDDMGVRDSLYEGVPHDDYRGSITLKEFYTVIANGTRLLHFAPNMDAFLVYNIPEDWTPFNGLAGLGEPTIYDKKTFAPGTPDYDEIAEHLGLKPKSLELKPIGEA